MWNMLKKMEIPEPLLVFMKNLYTSQESTVHTEHDETDLLQVGNRM